MKKCTDLSDGNGRKIAEMRVDQVGQASSIRQYNDSHSEMGIRDMRRR